MANVFRNKSLEKLSSPEQLDKLIVITSPLSKLAIIGGALIIIVTLIWSICGRVPLTTECCGILLSNGNISSVFSGTQGVVTECYANCGDEVKKGDVLYKVKSIQTQETIKALDDRIKKVKAVSFDSSDDVVTNDNSPLIELKGQKDTLDTTLKSDKKNLNKLKEKFNKAKNNEKKLKNQMETNKKAYYNQTGKDNSKLEFEYNKIATQYQALENTFQSAKANYNSAQNTVDGYTAQLDYYKNLYKKNSKNSTIATQYYAAIVEYEGYLTSAKKTLSNAKNKYNEAKKSRDSKKAEYDKKESAYINNIKKLGNQNKNTTKLSNEYNLSLSEYNTAKNESKTYETQKDSMEVQITIDKDNLDVQLSSLKKRFNATKDAIIDSLQQQKANFDIANKSYEIKAPVSGTLYTTLIANGSTVTIDNEVARIKSPLKDEKLHAVYYVQLQTGKKIDSSMKVNIYPSTVSKEEYGHINGHVTSVAGYVTSYADLVSQLGDETLAGNFSKAGAVVAVKCKMDENKDTASGFDWSSKKGKEVVLKEGTLIDGSIVTEEVAPITMFIPKLKETFSLE